MTPLPDGVALAHDPVKRLEGTYPAILAEREVLPDLERYDLPRDRLTVERAGRVEERLDSRRDAARHHVRAFAHPHHRAARGMLSDGPDVIEVPVTEEHGR